MRGLVGVLEVLLTVGLVLLLALHLLLVGGDKGQRSPVLLPGMVVSTAFDAQDPNPYFPDGKTLQTPPPGTFPRGYLPERAAGVLLDATTPWKDLSAEGKAAWAALKPPWAGTELKDGERMRLLARGVVVFESICITCHGPSGAGPTEVTKRGVPLPPSLLDKQAKDFADGQIYRFITHGNGNMPSHASQIEREDRWKVILYLRSMQAP